MNNISNAAAELGRKGRAANTEAQAAAARENGKKGGRPPEPKRTYMVCLFTSSTSHPAFYVTSTLKGAHKAARKRLKEYEPDCKYILKVEKATVEGFAIWEEVE